MAEVDYALLLVAIIGVAVGVAIKTITPWYLKLRKIEQDAEAQGMEPSLPKFSPFYIVTGVLAFIMAFAPNVGIAFVAIQSDVPTGLEGVIAAVIFTNALFQGLGANALLNDNIKTGGAVSFITGVKKPEETTKPAATTTGTAQPPK